LLKNYSYLFLVKNIKSFIAILFLFPLFSKAQIGEKNSNSGFKETYFSFAPFAIFEPHFAFGGSFGQRLTARSEYFTEASYVMQTPIFNQKGRSDNLFNTQLKGARIILQYRYHFLKIGRPIVNLLQRKHRKEQAEKFQPFIGVEFRYKSYNFSSNADFINPSIADTLWGKTFTAHANVLGGALIFGNTFNLTKDKRWKLELTYGIGGKQRFVKFKSVPKGYVIYHPLWPKMVRIFLHFMKKSLLLISPFQFVLGIVSNDFCQKNT